MKHTKYLVLLLTIVSSVIGANDASALTMTERVRGSILLQVESKGEAWYVSPIDDKRYYMRDGATAYQMMRSFGLGITDVDLTKIPSVTNEQAMLQSASACSANVLANRLKGRILLRVQQHGEAWYIHPEKCRRIYLKDGNTAYQVMRVLSLGVTNQNLFAIPTGLVAIDTTNWLQHEAGGPFAPYNFTFEYPTDFSEGVDIGAVLLIPKKYASASAGSRKPMLAISSFPLFSETDSRLRTEEYLPDLEKNYIVAKDRVKIGGYDAVALTSRDQPTTVAWFFTTYPNTYKIELGVAGTADPIVPLQVLITSTLRSDLSLGGIDEAILATMQLPPAFLVN
ncbi:MAG: hypothetical protein WC817_00035 [Patescibacteria group bacterium]|jgi:hypothetical protein